MKWGRMKSSPPSSRSSLITRVSPVSWFSKFKQKGGSSEASTDKKQQRGKLDFPTRNSSFSAGWREAIFYSVVDDDDDKAYWKLSFRKERDEGRRRTGRINLLWYDSDDGFQVPVSSFKSFGLREMEFPRGVHRSINDVVLDIEKMKEKQCRENILRKNGAFRKKKPNRGAQSRKGDVNDRRSRKLSRRVVRKKKGELETRRDDGEAGKSSKTVERDIFPIEPENMDQMKEGFQDTDEEDYVFADMDLEGSNAAVKTVCQVNSANISSRSHSRKIKQTRTKAYAQKTDCRIRVLEDMKKGRKKLKKKETNEHATVFNSFAVVKNSFNPQQDFRDSMVEMIRYKGIRRPEELEELLACYLTLNCDGNHDLIIKVFQQVWFELNGGEY